MSKADSFLKKILGEDFFESLHKTELWKLGTKTVLDHEEIKTALQIVPRTIMSFLIRELTPMQIGETKDIHLPVGGSLGADAVMHVIKHETDVYSGEIDQENKKVAEFKFRSLPGIGLVILSAFELYSMDQLNHIQPNRVSESQEAKVQKLIDDRLSLYDLVNRVVDNRLIEKEAVNKLLLMRLTQELQASKEEPKHMDTPKKVSPLKSFLDSRGKKVKPQEFSIELTKGETVNCPDCDKNIFDGKIFSGCVCLGDDMERRVFIKKTEDGIKVRFSKGWDQENIQMLLEVLRKKHG